MQNVPDSRRQRTDGIGTSTLLPEALGSTVALGDNTGTLQTQYTYEPFGYATTTGAASASTYKYTGREDDGSGLYYYRARYDHPRLQRFIAEDPIGFRGGDFNLYAYVGNNPMRLRDPLGLAAEDGFWSGVGRSVAAIGDSLDFMTGGIVGDGMLDWDLQRRGNPIMMAKCQGTGSQVATYGALGLAGIGAGGALFLGGIEVAVGAGYYDVAQSVAARHAVWEAGLGDMRFFSDTLTRSLINSGDRLTPTSLYDFFTTLRYGVRGSGDVSFNWIKRTITHYNPFF
jgi:RHS repeat-associated protein